MNKVEANYRPAEGAQACANCSMFQPPASCSLVEGDINPDAMCDYFKPKQDQGPPPGMPPQGMPPGGMPPGGMPPPGMMAR